MTHHVKIQIQVTEAEGVVKWNIYSPDGTGVSRTFGGDKHAAFTDACEFVKAMLIDGRTLIEQGKFLAEAMGLTIFDPTQIRVGKRVSRKKLTKELEAAAQPKPKSKEQP